jgi:CitMHS family citrate-Mg2+:H+ or citrate-Ca2+:H+ symporter
MIRRARPSGHATLASAVGLDGDGTTTALVGVSSMLPVYKRLGIDVMIFAVIGSMSFIIMNMSPWGGPAARVAASLHVDPSALFVPMLPVAATGLAFVFLLAWWFGHRERVRIGAIGTADMAQVDESLDANRIAEIFQADPAALRPRLIWFNPCADTDPHGLGRGPFRAAADPVHGRARRSADRQLPQTCRPACPG